jgi:amino acid transporter
MAAYKALPDSLAKARPRYMTPTVSTIAMGGTSIALYVAMNYMSSGAFVIADAVIAIGLFIAFYHGLGFACAWYYRKNLTSSARNLWM